MGSDTAVSVASNAAVHAAAADDDDDDDDGDDDDEEEEEEEEDEEEEADYDDDDGSGNEVFKDMKTVINIVYYNCNQSYNDTKMLVSRYWNYRIIVIVLKNCFYSRENIFSFPHYN